MPPSSLAQTQLERAQGHLRVSPLRSAPLQFLRRDTFTHVLFTKQKNKLVAPPYVISSSAGGVKTPVGPYEQRHQFACDD